MPERQRYLDGKNYAAWKVTEADYHGIKDLKRWAVLAPNSHNTQPWVPSVEGNTITVSPDPARALNVSDATKREMYISIGAAIGNMKVAANYFGLATDEQVERKGAISNGEKGEITVKRILFTEGYTRTEEDIILFEAIPNRVSNRNPHQDRPIPQEMRDAIGALSKQEGIHTALIEDSEQKEEIGRLVYEGNKVILNDSGFKGELAAWVRPNSTDAPDGMPGFGFGLSDVESIMFPAALIRSNTLAQEGSEQDKKRIAVETAAVGIISTVSDDPEAWMKAGEIFERIALKATSLGLSANVLAVLVETRDFHRDLQRLAGTSYRPQIMFRLGYPTAETPHAPRRQAEEIMEVGFGEERGLISTDKPKIFTLQEGVYTLEDLKRELGEVKVRDNYYIFLAELFKLRTPHIDLSKAEDRQALEKYIDERTSDYDGVWIYAPWRREITHVPTKDEYHEILFSRNNPCIEPEVARRLGELRVSLAGLSVGSNIAMGLVKTGVQHLKIADFDSIEASNLSRMAVGGIFDVGERKTKVLSQRIYEYDPFIELTVFEGGINDANMEEMVDKADIFIDHMDNIALKIRVRERAKKTGTIVIMATDIDKRPTFEVELPTDPIFNGRVSQEAIEVLREDPANFAEWARNAVGVFGLDNASYAVLNNFIKVNREEMNYGSQLGMAGDVAAGMISYLIYEIARGNADKLRKFRVVSLEQDDLVDREKDEEARERFKREFNIR